MFFEKFSALLFAVISFTVSEGQLKDPGIELNQVGFYPNEKKIAIVTEPVQSSKFYITNATGKDTVFTAILGKPIHSKNSSLITRTADFSAFKKMGSYIITAGGKNSFPFTIDKNIYHEAAVAVIKGYYYQRVSMPLAGQYAGKWNRPAGHPDTAVLVHPSAASEKRPAGTVISTPGGWYDAGDYNKYIVNSGISMGTMLSAYEDFPGYFDKLKTNIPESNNQVPDVLDELIYNLRWMLTMQDPNDGGVYNKCTNAAFDGMVMPGVTTATRYVVQKGTAATLDFAAVAAQSSRILRKFNKQLPGLADSCLKASIRAWQWAQQFPSMAYDQNELNKKFTPKITTGGYGDNRFDDEMFWAACELYITTKDEQYFSAVQNGGKEKFGIPSWGNVHMLGIYSLLRSKDLPASASTFTKDLKTRLVSFAGSLADSVDTNAFKTVMGKSPRDFNWGGNSNAANQGIALINAYLLTKNKRYVDLAITNLDYILGRNATGYSFITGIGKRSPMHPHHRQSVSDGIEEPVPGLMVGGPNPGKQDGCKYDFSEPETTYADEDCSYASNEIAINWNAPIVYLVNAIEALQHTVGYDK